MLGWNTGRFAVNKDQLATPTDRMLVCGVRKARIGRGSVPPLDSPELADSAEPIVLRPDRPGAMLSTLILFLGGVLGFGAVSWL